MTVESSVKSIIFKDTPNVCNTVPSSFVENHSEHKSKKPPMPCFNSKTGQMGYPNQLKMSKNGYYEINTSQSFTHKMSNEHGMTGNSTPK